MVAGARYDVLIVGTGHAGAQAASMLRQRRFAGTVCAIGEEPHLPYERPPLSKDYLSGTRNFEHILIRPPEYWESREVAMLTGRRVAAVDPKAHRVRTCGGESFGYGQLIWAAGGHPRRLSCSGHDLAGVHYVRNRGDVDLMMSELAAAERVVVIGAGYIGLEAAAVLRKLGKRVTVLEATDRVLARVTGGALSRFLEAEHRAQGVDIRLETSVGRILERDGRACGVELAGGETIPADLVIVGIGIVPSVEPLHSAGAKGDNGVAVDAYGRTSLPDIWAAGDCAQHANRFADNRPIRLESVQNATDSATAVAKAITGTPEPYHSVPWFWSEQYDLKLQTVGLSMGHDAAVTRGDMASRSFSIVYLKQGRVVALDCVNAVQDYIQGKRLVVDAAAVAPERLADKTVTLKDMHSKPTG